MRYLLSILILSYAALAQSHNYTTSCTGTENPLSESANWTNGLLTGLDWHDMRKTPGLCFGTQIGQGADDSTATLTGSWGSTQIVTATVHVVNACNATDFEEVELRTNTTISAHSITGYEFNWNCGRGGQAYATIVRWNGAINQFTYLANNGVHGSQYEIHEGDIVKATSLPDGGGCVVLSSFKNGTLQAGPVTDCNYTAGTPGMGMADGNFGGGALPSDFGFSTWNATDAGVNSLFLDKNGARFMNGAKIF